MKPVTASATRTQKVSVHPFAGLEGLLDLERSNTFHAGQIPVDLSRMERLLEALPPLDPPRLSIHVAGSEGKSTTTEFLAAGLQSAGLLTGTFTSPHLKDSKERIRVDGAFVEDDFLAEGVAEVLGAVTEEKPTWFEALTAVAQRVFARRGVEGVVWEAGLGGRLDSTRAMPADLCVLTTVSLEHTAILGDTIEAIAKEKAGILRRGVPMVVGPGVPDKALAVVEARAQEEGCPLFVVSKGADDVGEANRSLAVAALEQLVSDGRLSSPPRGWDSALKQVSLPGRMERVGQVLFDGAHTLAATRQLARSLGEGAASRLVFGATSGRSAAEMAMALESVAEKVILTRPPGPRGVDPESIASSLQGAVVEADPVTALARAKEESGKKGLVLVTGSLHLVGALLPEEGTDP